MKSFGAKIWAFTSFLMGAGRGSRAASRDCGQDTAAQAAAIAMLQSLGCPCRSGNKSASPLYGTTLNSVVVRVQTPAYKCTSAILQVPLLSGECDELGNMQTY